MLARSTIIPRSKATVALSQAEARALAAEAFVFGFPLVLMDLMRRQCTGALRPTASRAPMNQFAHRRVVPDATDIEVAFPNADTLRSLAWVDLRPEPMVLGLPEIRDRYYAIQFIDAWTNIFDAVGSRRNGGAAEEHVIVGPEWVGRVRKHQSVIRAPTNHVCLLARTETRRDDLADAHAVQNGLTITPMSVWQRPSPRRTAERPHPTTFDPGLDSMMPSSEQIARLDAVAFFERLASLMRRNRATLTDAPLLARFASLGFAPGRSPNATTYGEELAAGARRGRVMICEEAARRNASAMRGWVRVHAERTDAGVDYLGRSVRALDLLGTDRPDEIAHLRATVDEDERPLTGDSRYVLRFEVGGFPPARAFWSMAVYDARRAFAVVGDGRCTLSGRDPVVRETDGSLAIHLEPAAPGATRQANSLATPGGAFTLVLRLYAPSAELFDDSWSPPRIRRVV